MPGIVVNQKFSKPIARSFEGTIFACHENLRVCTEIKQHQLQQQHRKTEGRRIQAIADIRHEYTKQYATTVNNLLFWLIDSRFIMMLTLSTDYHYCFGGIAACFLAHLKRL